MLDGDLTIENAPLALGLKGELYGANAAWGVGPYDDNPLDNTLGVPEGALRYIGTTTVQPPDDTIGCVPITPATGATAGTPGTWTPANSAPPATFPSLTSANPAIVASPLTPWTTGENVVLGDGSKVHWSGTAWIAGVAA
jgi:hypothetical protein